MSKPTNVDEYVEWLDAEHSFAINDAYETHYDTVVARIERDFADGSTWQHIVQLLDDANGKYLVDNGVGIVSQSSFTPEILTKPYNSFLEKTFRKNILLNENWPEPPGDDWYLPSNWFSRIRDILRCTVVVRYLDGVEHIVEALGELCESRDIGFESDYEARAEGYYAAHFLIWQDFEIPKMDWDTEHIDVVVEIQVATVVHDVVRELLHTYYERRRASEDDPQVKWQWDYRSDEFAANYIGHMSHYLDGMIMRVRESQAEEPE